MKEKGMKTLNRLYGKIPGYDAEEEYEILAATIKAEEAWAKANKEIAWQAIFRGVNGVSLFSFARIVLNVYSGEPSSPHGH